MGIRCVKYIKQEGCTAGLHARDIWEGHVICQWVVRYHSDWRMIRGKTSSQGAVTSCMIGQILAKGQRYSSSPLDHFEYFLKNFFILDNKKKFKIWLFN